MDECRDKHNDLCASMEKKILYKAEAIESRINGIESVNIERGKALIVQAKELDRRLDILNGHQAALEKFQDLFVRYDRYEDRMIGIDRWIEKAKKDLNRLMVEHERRISTANWIAIVAIGVSVISVIFHFFYNMKGG